MWRLETPWALLIILAPILTYVWRRWRRNRKKGSAGGRAAVGFSSVENVKKAGVSLRQRLLWMPEAIRFAVIVLLAIGLARPQSGRERIEEISQGVAIEMVLDRSGSMELEMDFEGSMRNRLESAKEVFRRFVYGHDGKLKGRKNDLIGMVTFARYSDTVCPLTLSHGVLKPFLETVKLADSQAEDGTAIGDAVALAAARLHTVEETLAKQNKKGKDSYQIKSKVMILLTDGENNCGKRSVLQAGELARKWGIRIYIVSVGGGDSYQVVKTPFGDMRRKVSMREPDTRDLRKIAADTGGFFRSANDARALQSVYEEIDKLERSDVESSRFVDYKELYAPFVMAAFLLLSIERILSCTVFRRIP